MLEVESLIKIFINIKCSAFIKEANIEYIEVYKFKKENNWIKKTILIIIKRKALFLETNPFLLRFKIKKIVIEFILIEIPFF